MDFFHGEMNELTDSEVRAILQKHNGRIPLPENKGNPVQFFSVGEPANEQVNDKPDSD